MIRASLRWSLWRGPDRCTPANWPPPSQIPRILIPAVPGVLSALGTLVAAPHEGFFTHGTKEDWGMGNGGVGEWLHDETQPLQERAWAEMAAEGYAKEAVALQFQLDMRYAGQSHELTIPSPGRKRGLS
ncbi:MAG: hypothetical protein M5U34_02395 [Chloroflexi bacterium]|nr:hypothetical protein [Chloroflexota bacterium]